MTVEEDWIDLSLTMEFIADVELSGFTQNANYKNETPQWRKFSDTLNLIKFKIRHLSKGRKSKILKGPCS